MPNSQSDSISIIGAGLVGSLLAVLLKKKGFRVDVFEKREDPRKANSSAGRSINLVVTSRGLFALEQAGLTDEVRKLGVPVYGRMMHSVNGETAYQPYGQEDEYNLSISRDALNRFLISKAEEIGVIFHFDHELSALDVKAKSAKFSNSYVTNFDVLFGADGAGSKVRKQLALSFPSQLKDHTDWLEADYKELTLPLSSNGKAQLRTDALHIWPRGDHMMMALANKDGSFTVTLYLPKVSFEKLKSKNSISQLFEQEFRDAIPLMPNYLSEFVSHPQGVLGTVRSKKWTFDNIALIGDAAHAIVPFFGQGMNCGFEDCTELMAIVENSISHERPTHKGSSHKHNWKKIFSDFESARKENTDAIADMALENWVEMRDKVADQKFLLRKKVEALLEKRHPSVYKSRYGLITYTLVPYSLAQQGGRLQDEMFMELLTDVSTVNDVDWSHADRLVDSCWIPFVQRHKLRIERYP